MRLRRVFNLSHGVAFDESDEEVFLVYMSVAFVTRLRREGRSSIGIIVVAVVGDGYTRSSLLDVMTADILLRRR